MPTLPISWVLVPDPLEKLDPERFLSTDFALSPLQILTYFVRRWRLEVTFEEVRRHLGDRDLTAVVRFGHRSHHTLSDGAVFVGDSAGP
jgi:hypothetical protein